MWLHLRVITEEDDEDDKSTGSVSVDDLKVFLSAVLNFSAPFMKSE